MKPRVAITGIGVNVPIGRGVDVVSRALRAGCSGIGTVSLFDARSLPVRIGGEVKELDIADLTESFRGAAGEKDRKVWLGLDAARLAIADAALDPGAFAAAPVYVGMSLETFFLADVAPVAHEPDVGVALAARALAPERPVRLQTPLDRLVELLGERCRFSGGRLTNCSACAAGAQAIGEAFRAVRDGETTLALAGAADSILNPLGLGGFSLLQVLSSENERPTAACRPFDVTRQGTVLAEGAAFLILERADVAVRRGARIYAEVAGYGTTLDAYRVSDPSPDGGGAARSMARAIADAGLSAEDIDAINAHGTGTVKNDVAETVAIRRVFGSRAESIPVTANKSMTGHMIAASGAFEAAASALMLQTRCIPATLNLNQPDLACRLDHVVGAPRAFNGETVLSNSFGFGGQNASLVFRRFR